MKKSHSIRFLLFTSLAVAFIVVLLVTVIFATKTQSSRTDEFTEQYVDSLAKSYFDALNTMMVTGTIQTRELLRNKLTATQHVMDARVIRSDAINSMYGPGLEGEQSRSALEQRALTGELIKQTQDSDQGRVYTLIQPIVASANYQGVNCLACHGGQEGDILGAIRIDYSLQETDKKLQKELILGTSLQIGIFVLAFIGTAWLFNHLVMRRLHRLQTSMMTIAEHSDLSTQLDVLRHDELGAVSKAFNNMVLEIRQSLQQILGHADKVNGAAKTIAAKAETTEQEVISQKNNTDQVASAITQMAASAVQVSTSSKSTNEHSHHTAEAASEGEQLAKAAVAGIQSLNEEVQQGAVKIEQLASRSDQVGSVLEVIAGIAEQTNLLALNAAIEAARAGEQGRGFAVVADEVRSLASRTQNSTEEIKDTISALKSDASGCVSVMQQASLLATEQVQAIENVASRLQDIANDVRQISRLNSHMEQAANEQSTVSEMINQHVVEICRSAEQTSEDAQQTATVAEELLAMAQNLQQIIHRFKLD